MFQVFRKELNWGGRRLVLESGKIARQADGAVLATYGETTVLCTAVAMKSARPGQDFFPLTVNYQEKTFAAGKIPGGFFKREGRPSEKETLVSRLIDRPIRPLFVPGFQNETQVICTVLSHDLENDPDIVAMIGASAALALTFVWHAGRADEPFLPLSLIGGSVVPYAMLAGGCALGAMIGLTVHLPLYYEVVYHLTASEAGLGLIPLAAISTFGAAIAGRTMARVRHYKRVAIFGIGMGTPFPISVVALQNAVPRAQVGTITGAMNFFRAMMSSLTVAAFSAILLMALGADISLAEGARGSVTAIAAGDMVTAFRYVFAAATIMVGCASLCMIAMEERPLAGPSSSQPVEMAE
jgi:hypothetical protein